jgi:hypothetical protein
VALIGLPRVASRPLSTDRQLRPRRILGPGVACAPVEDLSFGFAMVTATLTLWRHAGSRTRDR